MSEEAGGSWAKIAEQLLKASPPLMLRAVCGEAVSTVVVRSVPNLPETDADLWATYGGMGGMALCGLIMLYAILRGR